MNQRIKQLIEQAEIKFESHPQHQGIDTAVIIPTDLEKFAELLVRECLSKVNARDPLEGRSEWGQNSLAEETIKRKIKQHFGVK